MTRDLDALAMEEIYDHTRHRPVTAGLTVVVLIFSGYAPITLYGAIATLRDGIFKTAAPRVFAGNLGCTISSWFSHWARARRALRAKHLYRYLEEQTAILIGTVQLERLAPIA